jgi:hypothetical protein
MQRRVRFEDHIRYCFRKSEECAICKSPSITEKKFLNNTIPEYLILYLQITENMNGILYLETIFLKIKS